jgi:gluconate 2-dehydrogenase gamma chain
MTMNRRKAVKLIAGASAAMWTPAHVMAARSKATAALAQAAQGTAFMPEFFSEHEHATVRLLVDLIIPADDRSGSATDAGVPEFMDFMMIDQPGGQGWMRGGLAWLDIECRKRFDRAFVDAADEQRTEVLDAIAWPERADDDLSHGVRFFNRFRDLTSSGFWSTEMGIDDLQYQGNVLVRQWNGCPEEALRHVGVLDADD